MDNWKMERAVITGPTGAVGTALCRTLLREGTDVWVVCRADSKRMHRLPQDERMHIVCCTLEELENLPAKIPGGVDVFFHFAWAHTIGAGRNDMSAQIRNIQYTIDSVRVAKALNCHTFIGAGSQAEYGRAQGLLCPDTPTFPENGYGMAKLCAGEMSRVECERLGLRHIWPRILSVYGPGDGSMTMISTVIRTLLKGEMPICTKGEQLWDYLYADDAGRAFSCMARYGKHGAVYPLGSGVAIPLREYIEQLRDAIDPQLPLTLGGIPYAPKQVMHLQADLSALSADTGFKPMVSFADGIRMTIEWMKKNAE